MKKSPKEKKRIRISYIKATGTWVIVLITTALLKVEPGVPWWCDMLMRLIIGYFAMQAAWAHIYERRYDELVERYNKDTDMLVGVCEEQQDLLCRLQGIDPAEVEIAATLMGIERDADEETEKEKKD